MAEKTRTFAEIAVDIVEDATATGQTKKLWAAIPYLRGMMALKTSDPGAYFGYDRAGDIVRYCLGNLKTYQGARARELKSELKEMIR